MAIRLLRQSTGELNSKPDAVTQTAIDEVVKEFEDRKMSKDASDARDAKREKRVPKDASDDDFDDDDDDFDVDDVPHEKVCTMPLTGKTVKGASSARW